MLKGNMYIYTYFATVKETIKYLSGIENTQSIYREKFYCKKKSYVD